MGLSRQEYWSGLPFPSPGDPPNPGIKLGSPTLLADILPSEPSRKPKFSRTIPISKSVKISALNNFNYLLIISDNFCFFCCLCFILQLALCFGFFCLFVCFNFVKLFDFIFGFFSLSDCSLVFVLFLVRFSLLFLCVYVTLFLFLFTIGDFVFSFFFLFL